MPKVTFDGENRRIDVLPGVVQIDVARDLYSAWKEWLIEDPINMRWLQAFRSAGGDPTNLDATQFSPRYFFLMNGWRVYIANGNVIDVQLNLYTDNPDGVIYVTSNDSGVNARTSDAAVVISEIQQSLEYNQAVYVDLDSPHSGKQYPYGLFAQPVNNLTDAIDIANHYGFNQIYLRGNLTLDQDFEGMELHSWTGYSEVTLTGTSIANSEFYGLFINGDFGPNRAALFDQCFIRDGVTNVDGYFRASTFSGHFTLRSGGKFHTFQSYCDGEGWPIMDMNPDVEAEIDMNIKGWMGRLSIRNFNSPHKRAIIGFNNGRLRMEPSCTAGFLSISGIPWAALIDQMDSDPNNRTTLERAAMLPSHQQLNEALQMIEYGNVIYIDSSAPESGTEYPYGTASHPVNNAADAEILSQNLGINRFFLDGDIHLPIDVEDFYIEGTAGVANVYLYGTKITDVIAKNVTIHGDFGLESENINLENCILADGVTNVNGFIKNSGFLGEMTMRPNTDITFIGCYSLVPGTDSPTLNAGEDSEVQVGINIRGYSGGMLIKNFNSPNKIMTIEYASGRCRIDDTNTDGVISVRGIPLSAVVDESNGAFIEKSALLTSQETLEKTIESIEYGDRIYISTMSGFGGTEFPVGTASAPVNNLADALFIAEKMNIYRFTINDFLLIDQPLLKNYIFSGITGFEQIQFVGMPIGVCTFEYLTLNGDMNVQQGTMIRHCQIQDIQTFDGLMDRCVIVGNVELKEGCNATIVENISISYWEEDLGNIDCQFTYPNHTEGALPTTLNVRGFMGSFRLSNMNHEQHKARLHMSKGRLWIDDTCTEGMVGAVNINKRWITNDAGEGILTNFEDLGEQIDIKSIEDIRQQLAKAYNGEIELGSIDHILDRLDKNTQK